MWSVCPWLGYTYMYIAVWKKNRQVSIFKKRVILLSPLLLLYKRDWRVPLISRLSSFLHQTSWNLSFRHFQGCKVLLIPIHTKAKKLYAPKHLLGALLTIDNTNIILTIDNTNKQIIFMKSQWITILSNKGRVWRRRYGGQIVWNACTWFPEIGTILRGGGQLQFGIFPKIHPIF